MARLSCDNRFLSARFIAQDPPAIFVFIPAAIPFIPAAIPLIPAAIISHPQPDKQTHKDQSADHGQPEIIAPDPPDFRHHIAAGTGTGAFMTLETVSGRIRRFDVGKLHQCRASLFTCFAAGDALLPVSSDRQPGKHRKQREHRSHRAEDPAEEPFRKKHPDQKRTAKKGLPR